MRVSELHHYVLENGKLHRTNPVALTPQEFVSFWLRHPWNEVSEWTAQTSRAISSQIDLLVTTRRAERLGAKSLTNSRER
jgi:hypothetical protein